MGQLPGSASQFEPGLRYKYSGGGTTISQLMLQDVSGRAYAEYMYKEVLQPLGMTMSSYAQPTLPQSEPYLATGYGFSGQPVPGNYHLYPEQAAAALWSNAEDMARYIIATQRSLQGEPSAVLDTAFTRLRLTPYIDSNAALGVFISNKGGRSYFGHNGSNAGFQSVYTGSMQGGDGVVIFVNSDNGRILQEIVNSVAKVYGWAGYHQPEVRKLVLLTPAMINTYTGNYLVETDSIRIHQNASQLILSINNQQRFKMYFTAPGSFFTKELPMRFEFDKDAGGSVTGFHFEQYGKKVPVKKLD
ncbi:MAG: beta-lactamase family protein [Chitinophagaceae bacterium]|nr:beta-lactamase family protein [Chitinophagaceae bacterium]